MESLSLFTRLRFGGRWYAFYGFTTSMFFFLYTSLYKTWPIDHQVEWIWSRGIIAHQSMDGVYGVLDWKKKKFQFSITDDIYILPPFTLD
jgi:hypothetical protein